MSIVCDVRLPRAPETSNVFYVAIAKVVIVVVSICEYYCPRCLERIKTLLRKYGITILMEVGLRKQKFRAHL
jgi:hypothetical protein